MLITIENIEYLIHITRPSQFSYFHKASGSYQLAVQLKYVADVVTKGHCRLVVLFRCKFFRCKFCR